MRHLLPQPAQKCSSPVSTAFMTPRVKCALRQGVSAFATGSKQVDIRRQISLQRRIADIQIGSRYSSRHQDIIDVRNIGEKLFSRVRLPFFYQCTLSNRAFSPSCAAAFCRSHWWIPPHRLPAVFEQIEHWPVLQVCLSSVFCTVKFPIRYPKHFVTIRSIFLGL